MYTKTYSATLRGIDAKIIGVEIDASKGVPGFNIVGLPDKSISEAKERIFVAMRASEFEFHPKRVLINLSPAQSRKEGTQFDLAIVTGLLVNFGYIDIDPKFLENFCFLGELSLLGEAKAVTGFLSYILEAEAKKLKYIIVPKTNEEEANLVSLKENFKSEIFTIANLTELKNLVEALHQANPQNEEIIQKHKVKKIELKTLINSLVKKKKEKLDLGDVIGQAHAKRGLEIAAAGRHHILMIGPPGCGKSMLAKRFISLIPDLNFDQILETTKIYSVSGSLKENLILETPLRSPHHSASSVSLTGGGMPIRPGEVSLAHNGVLFLDELTEFDRHTVEQLRQILEDKSVTLNRARQSLNFPANFILITACNPCPCGYLGDNQKECSCSLLQISRYISKLSGPLLDRIDLHLELRRLNAEEISKLTNQQQEISFSESKPIQERVLRSRKFIENPKNKFILKKDAKEFIDHTIFNLNLSARSHQKIIKISQTIASLEESSEVDIKHIAEAMQFRSVAWEKYKI